MAKKKKASMAKNPPKGFAIDKDLKLRRESSLKKYSKIDYHIHSSVGDAVVSPQEIMDFCEKHTDLDLIAITDHDQIKGSFMARDYAKKIGTGSRL